jgi:ferredoxin/flavodoxin
MVLFFSATGNTEFIARQIALKLGDECLNLLDRVRRNDHSVLHSEKPFIICAPVYVCEMPRFLAKYLKEQTFTGSKDVYFIFTSGGYAGISGQLAKGIIRKKKMNYLGHAEFKMPRNYVANDHYPMLPYEAVRERILNSARQLEGVAADIQAGRTLKARHVYLFETLITVPFNPVWSKLSYKTKDFYTTDGCMGCGKCERVCPMNNVSLKDRKPVWGNNCTHCMACICNCPMEAIEYGKTSVGKVRYKCPEE